MDYPFLMLAGHGGDRYTLAKELGITVEQVLDFSSNVSPLGPPQGLLSFLKDHIHQIEFLPEVDSLELRQALAERYQCEPDNFLVTSGTTEWIFQAPSLLKPSKVIIPLPTYSDYRDASIINGLKVEEVLAFHPFQKTTNFLELIKEKISPGALLFICNPNNPTGQMIDPAQLHELIASHPEAYWIVDESYAPFAGPDKETSLIFREHLDNLMILRSFSKLYCIPGLRLGYAFIKNTSSHFLKILCPWAVNRLAQLAGRYLLHDKRYEDKVRNYIKREINRIFTKLNEISYLTPYPTDVNFMLIEVKDPFTAQALTQHLGQKAILIRNCANFLGLSGEFIRISIKSPEDNDHLIKNFLKLTS